MELFYAYDSDSRICRLDADESGHCCRVLRHRVGDEVNVIDGLGTMYRCRLVDDNPKGAEAEVLEAFPGWGGHPYRLTVACCPTKNNDRFEWFVEKATEIGVDRIVPTIGERSERKVYKTDRAVRISLSATKQSLKSRIPEIAEPLSVKDFIQISPLASLGRNDNEDCHFERSPEGGVEKSAYWYFRVSADRFLRNMVRAIVGTLIEVGRGKHEPQWVKELIETGTRGEAGESVPGHALFLGKIRY